MVATLVFLFGIIALITYICMWLSSRDKLLVSYIKQLKIYFRMLNRKSARTDFLKWAYILSRKHEKRGKTMFRIWFIKPILVVFDPVPTKQFMNDPAVNEKPIHYNMFKVFFGNSIFISTGERWKKQKKILKPAFHHTEIRQKFPTFNIHAEKLVERLSQLENNTTNNIMHILKHSTIGTFLDTLLGLEEDNSFGASFFLTLTENIDKMLEFIPVRVSKFWLYTDFSLHIFPEGRKILKISNQTYDMIQQILEKLKEDMVLSENDTVEIDDEKPKLLGEILIEAHLKDPSFTMDDIVREMITLFGAGYGTTAAATMWCLYLLGLHHDVQNRLKTELEMTQGDVTDEDLRNMEYLDCVLKESIRIYNIIPVIGKCASRDLMCGDLKIEKGTVIVLLPFVVHNNRDMYPDPKKFDPERFRYTKQNYSERLYFVPFGEGLRPCVGKNYALSLTKIMLVHIIRKFKVISLDRREDVKLSWDFILQPTKPLRMQFIPRDKKPEIATAATIDYNHS